MSTSAQIDANRRNAILSTGPRSEAGKSAVSRNALSHGLSSAAPVLACEDQAAYDSLVESLTSELQPCGEQELFCVQQMAQARWRLNRIQNLERALLNLLLGEADPASPYTRIADSLLTHDGDVLSKLDRYAASAERSYYKAHKELCASVKLRTAQQKAAQARRTDVELATFLQPPVCKTKPISDAGDEDLERLTRPEPFPALSPERVGARN